MNFGRLQTGHCINTEGTITVPMTFQKSTKEVPFKLMNLSTQTAHFGFARLVFVMLVNLLKIPGDPLEKLYLEYLGSKFYTLCGIPVARKFITKVEIFNRLLLQKEIHPNCRYAVASEFTIFQPLGTVENLTKKLNGIIDPKITCDVPNGLFDASFFWEMLAVAKWIGDLDCIGGSGGNTGNF